MSKSPTARIRQFWLHEGNENVIVRVNNTLYYPPSPPEGNELIHKDFTSANKAKKESTRLHLVENRKIRVLDIQWQRSPRIAGKTSPKRS